MYREAALVVPVALLPLRYHVDDVLVAIVLLAVSSAALARAEWPPRIVAGVSAALSFNYFYVRPYDQFGGGGVQGVETTVVLALAVPVLAIRDDLDQLADVLTETLNELRDLARGVHPAILAEAGLGSALQGLARRSALPVRLHLHADGRLPAESEATAYYVVCEAFANAVKHARASAIDIGVDIVEGMLTVRVSDDGVGADASCGSGLTGIRDRVEAVGGTLAVHSPPGSGTVLTARLPPGDPFG